MSVLQFPREAVAALFLERQHLEQPRRRRFTVAALERFVEDVGGLQLDSINVIARAHYLTVWSRFGVYDPARLDRFAYRDRVLHEYWAHAACMVPREHLAMWRRAMADYRLAQTGWSKFLRTNKKMVAEVEKAIRERGPLGNADFRQKRPRGATAGWWNWKPATFALHWLWMSGRIAVHSRVHFHKRFDIAGRVWPRGPAGEMPDGAAFRRWHLRRSLHAMGAATETDIRMYLSFPRWGLRERKKVLEQLLRDGEAVEIAVQGDKNRWYALAEDLPALRAAARRRVASRGTTLLAPFDSFLWHRERTQRLFGFTYRIEVYTPGHKRTHGYYTLPILHDGQLIGRLDAKTHREARTLEVRSIHFERWFAAGLPPPAVSWGAVAVAPALEGVAEAVRSLATFVGAERATLGRVAPAELREPMVRALEEGVATPVAPGAAGEGAVS